MRDASEQRRTWQRPVARGFCLTNMSVSALVGCAGVASAFLWLCIWAVL